MAEELKLELHLDDTDTFFWAMANKTRRKILKLLIFRKKLNVTAIAYALEQTEANISYQIQILEKAKLVKADFNPGKHGINKFVSLTYSKIFIFLNSAEGEVSKKWNVPGVKH